MQPDTPAGPSMQGSSSSSSTCIVRELCRTGLAAHMHDEDVLGAAGGQERGHGFLTALHMLPSSAGVNRLRSGEKEEKGF